MPIKLPTNIEVENESNNTPTLTELFNDISTAINNKTGKSEVISAIDFADEINNIKILNGIDEIITPETPVAYFDYNAGEPKQLDSEDSGDYLISVDGGYGVTNAAYVGQLESGAPYVYNGDSLEELDSGVYNVYNNSGMHVEPADETSLNSGSYYQADSSDSVYYTGSNPLTEVDFNNYSGLYYLDDAEVVNSSDMESVYVESGNYYRYNGNGDFSQVSVDRLSSGVYRFAGGVETVDGSSVSPLSTGVYYINGSETTEINLNSSYAYQYQGDGYFTQLDSYELYYIDGSGYLSTVSNVYSGCAYTYEGNGEFTMLDNNALYRSHDYGSEVAVEKVELPADVDHPTYVTIGGVEYQISLVPSR